jgi:hypothetical protein
MRHAGNELVPWSGEHLVYGHDTSNRLRLSTTSTT